MHAFRDDDQFVIIIIIQAADDSDTYSTERGDWLEDAQQVGIQFLTINAEDTGEKAVVYRVNKVMLRMTGSHRPVDLDGQGLTDILYG